MKQIVRVEYYTEYRNSSLNVILKFYHNKKSWEISALAKNATINDNCIVRMYNPEKCCYQYRRFQPKHIFTKKNKYTLIAKNINSARKLYEEMVEKGWQEK